MHLSVFARTVFLSAQTLRPESCSQVQPAIVQSEATEHVWKSGFGTPITVVGGVAAAVALSGCAAATNDIKAGASKKTYKKEDAPIMLDGSGI